MNCKMKPWGLNLKYMYVKESLTRPFLLMRDKLQSVFKQSIGLSPHAIKLRQLKSILQTISL